ncbi:MAG: DUF4424 domain-containing protein [Hoeflea sp.]|nr:DUF4424 domain-containing protein [Alphaproteobacteria bacterium]MBV1722422.1 DUF4424 domain-containing protein [Hoeflea sp.]MBU4543156.1 DUF4424 domain-containing protein [Alphaproteobacteria bacterium]MBU4550304.1 DUF4424 domain-containing protein [Alphaproteobacteria bacterium]MBV1761572.1 DUF4424 domain-containing protein [Hoeflea sp.]
MKFTALAILMLFSVAQAARANDTTAEMKTGGLVFVQTDAISMVEEKLYISPREVRVEYRFRNITDRDVEALVAFPVPDIEGGYDRMVAVDPDAGDNFLGFEASQDGVPIKAELQQQAVVHDVDLSAELKAENIPLMPGAEATAAALSRLGPQAVERFRGLGLIGIEQWDDGSGMKDHLVPLWTLKSVYWWKTVYPANSEVTVSHRYTTSVGGTVDVTYLDENGEPRGERFAEYEKRYCLDDAMVRIAQKNRKATLETGMPLYVENWISYILMTGNNWAGPIGSFTLTIDKGDTRNVVSFCGEGVTKTGPTTFEMKKTDFYPERDLEILLLVPAGF